VFAAIGGRPVAGYQDPAYRTQYTMLSLASNAVRVVQKEELLGREPDAKEAGDVGHENWPDGLNYEGYLAAIRTARQGLASPSQHP
jgi:hypothetical protein